MAEVSTAIQNAALFEKLGIIGVLFLSLVATILWARYILNKYFECAKDKEETIEKQTNSFNQALLESSKLNERTSNILKDLEDKMEKNHNELVSKLNKNGDILIEVKSKIGTTRTTRNGK